MLNPSLYRVLIKHFGDVKVFNEGVSQIKERIPGTNKEQVVERGESYNVDCPICGDDKQRLSVGYLWLTRPPLRNDRITYLANCYNEDCDVRSPEFYEQFLDDLKAADMGLLDDIEVSERVTEIKSQKGAIPMPDGCVPLHKLSPTHPAIQALRGHYAAFSSLKALHYLSTEYGACFTSEYDWRFPPAQDRVIFPITKNGAQVAWQGRAIDPDDKPRWYMPPGFVKCFYNLDNLDLFERPVLNEGLMNAIVCGPNGIAMFGKQLNSIRAEELGEQCSSIIIATDADTFVPDNRKGAKGRIFAHELREVLQRYIPDVRMLHWPQEVLDLATRHNNNEDVAVPDAADLGFKVMHKLIKEVS